MCFIFGTKEINFLVIAKLSFVLTKAGIFGIVVVDLGLMKVIGFTIATLCLSLISNGQNLCFTNPVYSPVAGGASYINRCGVADFNSDGQPDFAQPTNGGSNVYLCLSSGTNTYLA
ncbi:MAG: hypothetical protein KBG47_12950, partial [Bacteroidia bacterium]|nr:hypothetical protein [Bacteroidia bacterium]